MKDELEEIKSIINSALKNSNHKNDSFSEGDSFQQNGFVMKLNAQYRNETPKFAKIHIFSANKFVSTLEDKLSDKMAKVSSFLEELYSV